MKAFAEREINIKSKIKYDKVFIEADTNPGESILQTTLLPPPFLLPTIPSKAFSYSQLQNILYLREKKGLFLLYINKMWRPFFLVWLS